MLDGWTTRRLADGVGLFPPEGASAGSIRVRDRRRPLRTVRAVRDRAVAAIGGARELGPIERLVTDEGELAAITTTRLEAGEHSLGVIFGDDLYTQLDVFTGDPGSFERYRQLARELVAGYGLGLGSERVRRPYYQPPAGWSGYPRGLSTLWYPPGFPADPTAITVLPAIPLECARVPLSELVDQRGAPVSRPIETYPLRAGELEGSCARLVVGSIVRLQLQLCDARFAYTLRLECPIEKEAESRAVLDALLASLEPIRRPARVADTDVFSFWTS